MPTGSQRSSRSQGSPAAPAPPLRPAVHLRTTKSSRSRYGSAFQRLTAQQQLCTAARQHPTRAASRLLTGSREAKTKPLPASLLRSRRSTRCQSATTMSSRLRVARRRESRPPTGPVCHRQTDARQRATPLAEAGLNKRHLVSRCAP